MGNVFTPYRKRISAVRWVFSTFLVFVLVVIWGYFLRGDLRSFKVISGSMEPTLRVGDYVLTRPAGPPLSLRGRIIAFEDPQQAGEIVTKRVVACPGDVVEVFPEGLRIAGRFIVMPDRRTAAAPFRRLVVPGGTVFVLGDNRANSVDSLDYGPVATDRIIGEVFLRYWPPDSIGWVH